MTSPETTACSVDVAYLKNPPMGGWRHFGGDYSLRQMMAAGLEIERLRSSSPTPDGVIKERGEDKEAERALRDGLSQVEPASGLNPPDFDPSRMLLQSFLRDLAAAVTARLNCRAGDGSAEQSWDDIAQVMCSWMVQGDQRMLFGDYVLSVLRARDQRAERGDGASRPRPEAASPVVDATSGGEAPGRDVPEGWEYAAGLSNAAGSRWTVTLRRVADGHLVAGESVASVFSANAAACELARRAPALRLAEGCCSAVSPCSHQRRNPYTICDICQQAHSSAAPRPSQREG